MGRGRALQPGEEDRILHQVRESPASYRAVAHVLGRSPDTIEDVARRNGIDSGARAAQIAYRAKSAFDQARRYNLLSSLAAHVEQQLLPDATPTANDLRNLAIAGGVAIDKQRLEEGLSTENHAVNVRTWRARAGSSTPRIPPPRQA